MGEKNMISVIVPVYNVEKYIERCVESVLTQTYKEFEIILVNDGSTDLSGEICEKLRTKDHRIRVFHQENKGLSAARNRGLKEAEGEYITYIDSDDYVDALYLEILHRNAVLYEADISVCGFQLAWESHKTKKRVRGSGDVNLYSGRNAAAEIVEKNRSSMITAWGKLYHHSLRALLMYPEGKIHEDEFVTYRVLYAAKKVVETGEPLYYYFQRENSITNDTYSKSRLDKIAALKESIVFFEEQEDEEMRKYAIKRYLLSIQIAWYRVKKYLPDENRILKELKTEWSSVYRKNKDDIMEKSTLVDKVSILVYRISPTIYSVIADYQARK